MHANARKAVQRFLHFLDWDALPIWHRGLVVEFGSRDVNGGVNDLFRESKYVGVDISPGRNVDVVCDAAVYRPPRAADLVITTEMLEHASNCSQIIDNTWQILRDGGALIVTAASEERPSHSAIDGGPLHEGEYFQGIDRKELQDWLLPFRFVMIDSWTPQDIYALAIK